MITIKDLSFRYHKIDVLKQISLNFERGKIYGLLGENGVGKTTLLKVISGLQQPHTGSCEVDGMRCFDRNPLMLQNMIFLPETVYVAENKTPLKYARDIAPFYPNYDEAKFMALAQQMSIDVNTKFKSMSFGMQKKAVIAACISLNTEVVLLDEPTNGLDIPSKAELRKILTEAVDENKTIIISTHQVKDVENLIDAIVILSQQEILLHADTADIGQRLAFVYSDTPLPEALYYERQPAGFLNVTENKGEEELLLDIEALFNATIQNKDRIKQIFQNQPSNNNL